MKKQTYKAVVYVLHKYSGVEKKRILFNSKINDLGLDSLDKVEVIMELEDKFNIEVKDEAAEQCVTVFDICNLIEKYVQEVKDWTKKEEW